MRLPPRQLLAIAALLALGAPAWAASEGPGFGAPGVASDGPSALRPRIDPIHVFFPRGPCESDHLQLETWDRYSRTWAPHPQHARIPVESCQIEDAGWLLNELRWRCEDVGIHNPWHVGLDVFDPAITGSCAVGALQGADTRIDIHVSTPSRSTMVRSAERKATLSGSVRIDGLEGVAYDVLLVLDRSGSEPADRTRLHAQVEAAARFVEEHRPRLGDMRIGIVSYPNPGPARGESRKGRLELPLTSDARLLQSALHRVAERGVAGEPAFADGLEHGLNQLLLFSGGSDRPAARRVLVISGDGRASPFAAGEPDPLLLMQLDGLADELRRNGVRLHALALGGYAEGPTPLVSDLVARSFGRYQRIPHGEFDTRFFRHVALPRPTALEVTNPRTGVRRRVGVDARGHFALEIPLEAGRNALQLHAITSDGQHDEREWVVEYDESQYLELVLEAERSRLLRERERQRKQLEMEALPEVGAGPP